jgi:hypothetical protein
LPVATNPCSVLLGTKLPEAIALTICTSSKMVDVHIARPTPWCNCRKKISYWYNAGNGFDSVLWERVTRRMESWVVVQQVQRVN